MELRILKESQVTQSLDEEIRKNLVISFPHNEDIFSHSRKWRGNVPFYNVVLLDGDIVCAHVAVVDRTILAGGTNLRVAGVANVFVLPGYRGKGLSDKILITAMAEAKKLEFDCGLLFTGENIKHIYTRNGWLRISGQKFIAVANGIEYSLPPNKPIMYYPLSNSNFPPGTIHLQGNRW